MYLHTICEDEITGREATARSLSDDVNTFLILQISNKLLCKLYFMLVYSVIKRPQWSSSLSRILSVLFNLKKKFNLGAFVYL